MLALSLLFCKIATKIEELLKLPKKLFMVSVMLHSWSIKYQICPQNRRTATRIMEKLVEILQGVTAPKQRTDESSERRTGKAATAFYCKYGFLFYSVCHPKFSNF